MKRMSVIDGSQGEGGGQILRTTLALSMVTGQPVKLVRIRAGRRQPGLRPQQLAAVRAAAEVSEAEVVGAELGSRELEFSPGPVKPGRYDFSVGTAGSATLVLQTVLPPLLTASAPSHLTLEGGTHNPMAPPFEFLARAFLPLVERMGPRIEPHLERHGFAPAGGGRFTVTIHPVEQLQPLELLERGRIQHQQATAIVADLPDHIAERELETARRLLGWKRKQVRAERIDTPAGPGNVLLIELASEHVTEVFTGFGRPRVPAETVAKRAAREAHKYRAAGVPVGAHLADQLVLPLAVAGGGAFRTVDPSAHTTTNRHVLEQLADVEVFTERLAPDDWRIEVRQRRQL